MGEPLLTSQSAARALLPDADREAQWVGTLFSDSVLLLGRDATADAILRHLSQTVTFHFAGHAISGPDGTGLEVTADTPLEDSPNSLLGPDRIAMADLHSLRLAVLSACSTGRSGEYGFAEPGNLAAAFLRAGVPDVLASRWNVDSSATARFMSLIYPALTRGGSITNSLVVASRQAGSYPGSSHPYFWAAFSVYGRA